MKVKCQLCGERAVIHITEVEPTGEFKQIHFCYRHAQEYLKENEAGAPTVEGLASSEAGGAAADVGPALQCPVCGVTIEEFRQVGRLGCPHDYEVFRDELRPLLESVHGALRHLGKVPRRLPADTRRQTELIKLRQEMQQAIAVEDYERAAKLRDRIDTLEKG
jgi:protein arginine kinase activator